MRKFLNWKVFYRIELFTILAALMLTSFRLPEENTLVVKISGLKSSTGQVYIVLYSNENQYTDNPYLAIKKSKNDVINGSLTVDIPNLSIGTYAFTILDDENKNDEMDFSFFGIPEEGYGFSNNQKPSVFGPPDYNKCTFEVRDKTIIEASIQYW